MPAMSSVSRTNGERLSTAGGGEEASRWAVFMGMRLHNIARASEREGPQYKGSSQ
jgi:hypothetical protein